MHFCMAESIKVYDGYSSLRKQLFRLDFLPLLHPPLPHPPGLLSPSIPRTITISKYSSKEELLQAAMKAFVVTQVGLEEGAHFFL